MIIHYVVEHAYDVDAVFARRFVDEDPERRR
jgi:hypothetical protein